MSTVFYKFSADNGFMNRDGYRSKSHNMCRKGHLLSSEINLYHCVEVRHFSSLSNAETMWAALIFYKTHMPIRYVKNLSRYS